MTNPRFGTRLRQCPTIDVTQRKWADRLEMAGAGKPVSESERQGNGNWVNRLLNAKARQAQSDFRHGTFMDSPKSSPFNPFSRI